MTGPLVKLTKKDFVSDQEVKWCPGCADFAILAGVQKLMPELGVAREKTVFVSGIGCSSRFPYYMNTYGSITQAVIESRQAGLRVGHVHLRHIFPLPNDLTDVVARYRKLLIPELNLGQLRLHLRGQLGIEGLGLNKIQGKPFHVAEIRSAIESLARHSQPPAEKEIA